jgi:hypothetical protein
MRIFGKDRSNLKKTENPIRESEATLFGLDEEISLQSVNFATTENSLLNERFHEDSPDA